MDVMFEWFTELKDKLYAWGEQGVLILPNFLIACLVLLLFAILGKWVKKISSRYIDRFTHNALMGNIGGSILQIILMLVGIFFALEILQLSKVVTSLLAGAGIVGLAIGIAFQDFVGNIISGIYLAIKRPIQVGHFIESNDHFGKIVHMTLRNTTIETTQGQVVYMPNKMLFDSPLINYSQRSIRRVDIPVGVSYSDDLEQAKQIALDAIQTLSCVVNRDDITLVYDEFGDSSINFSIRFWTKFSRQFDYRDARSQAIIAIKKAFDAHNITIPFPIRTLDFDSSVLGK